MCAFVVLDGDESDELMFFAYSESKLTCHFVLVVLVLVVLVLVLAKRSEKVGKRSKKVAFI